MRCTVIGGMSGRHLLLECETYWVTGDSWRDLGCELQGLLAIAERHC